MTRLHTFGFESQILSTTANQHGESDAGVATVTQTGVPVLTTSVVRSGLAAIECPQGAINYVDATIPGMTLDRAYFVRAYVRFSDATPSAQSLFLAVVAGAANTCSVRLNTDGTIALYDNAPVQVGSPSAGLSDNTWYRVELKIIIPTAGSGTLELLLDGSTIASTAAADVNNSVAGPVLRLGSITAVGSGTTYVDDVAINDDQGANQNSYPGAGKVIHLRPTADSAIGNWEGPQTTGSDVTDLWDNVDTNVPAGTAHADTDAAAGKYVFNIVSSANQNFDVNCQTYTAAGIVASDTVTLCQALARMSCNTTTGTNTGAVAGVSNPAITAVTAKNLELVAIAGTEPAGWKCFRTAPSYAPAVTLGTSPVIRATKEVANVNAAMIDLMGLLVEYQPAAVVATVKNLSALGVG